MIIARYFSSVLLALCIAIPCYCYGSNETPTNLEIDKSLSGQPKLVKTILRYSDLVLDEKTKTVVDSVCGEVVSARIDIVNVNGDMNPDYIILGGNTCLSGGVEKSIWLLIAEPDGKFSIQFGFPASGYKIFGTRSNGTQDIRIDVKGCSSIWKWNGKTYDRVWKRCQEPF